MQFLLRQELRMPVLLILVMVWPVLSKLNRTITPVQLNPIKAQQQEWGALIAIFLQWEPDQ